MSGGPSVPARKPSPCSIGRSSPVSASPSTSRSCSWPPPASSRRSSAGGPCRASSTQPTCRSGARTSSRHSGRSSRTSVAAGTCFTSSQDRPIRRSSSMERYVAPAILPNKERDELVYCVAIAGAKARSSGHGRTSSSKLVDGPNVYPFKLVNEKDVDALKKVAAIPFAELKIDKDKSIAIVAGTPVTIEKEFSKLQELHGSVRGINTLSDPKAHAADLRPKLRLPDASSRRANSASAPGARTAARRPVPPRQQPGPQADRAPVPARRLP